MNILPFSSDLVSFFYGVFSRFTVYFYPYFEMFEMNKNRLDVIENKKNKGIEIEIGICDICNNPDCRIYQKSIEEMEKNNKNENSNSGDSGDGDIELIQMTFSS